MMLRAYDDLRAQEIRNGKNAAVGAVVVLLHRAGLSAGDAPWGEVGYEGCGAVWEEFRKRIARRLLEGDLRGELVEAVGEFERLECIEQKGGKDD